MSKVKSVGYRVLLGGLFVLYHLAFPSWLGSSIKSDIDALFTDFATNWPRIGTFIGLFVLFMIISYFGVRFLMSLEPDFKVKEIWTPPLTVLIASLNEKPLLARTLQSIVDTDYPKDKLQVVVVTSNSTDGSTEFCKELAAAHGEISWSIVSDPIDKRGKPPALNLGLKHARHDFVAIYDAGVILKKDTLKYLVSPLKDDTIHATVGPVLVRNWNVNGLTKGGLVDYVIISGGSIYSELRNKFGDNCYLFGRNICVRKSVLDQFGGFDEDSLTEDLYLTAVMELHGMKIKFVPQAKIYEDIPETWNVLKKQRSRWVGGYSGDMPRLMEMKVGEKDGKFVMINRNMTMLMLAHMDIWILVHLAFLLIYTLVGEFYLLGWTIISFVFHLGYVLNGIRKYGDGHYSCIFYVGYTAKIHGFMFQQQFKTVEVSWEKTPMILERSQEEIEELARAS